jgi:hypothetical protein
MVVYGTVGIDVEQILQDFRLWMLQRELYRLFGMIKIEKNQSVSLMSSKGIIQRVVVEDLGDIITVTTLQELESSKRDGRPPAVAGFPKSDLIVNSKT